MTDEILNRLEMMLIGDNRTAEDVQSILNAVQIVLYDYDISKKEKALSTQVETPNEKYIKQFLAIKKVSGLGERTLKGYANELHCMCNFINKPIKEITTNDIRVYLAKTQMDRGVSNSYLDTKLRYMRSFFKTMRIEGYITTDPTEKIDKIKVPKVIREAFSEEELEILRKEASKDVRTLAIVEFLCSTGCRVSEASNANRTDIDNGKVLITGKGNKQRYVYLNARAKLALKNYFNTRNDDLEAMFVSFKHNSKNQPQRLSFNTIEALIRELGRATGIENCHPHRFRRTMATHALRRGMPIEQVSLMLGHEELTTTQIYARSDEADIRAAHRKYC